MNCIIKCCCSDNKRTYDYIMPVLKRTRRSSVVPYVKTEGKIYFLFGIDKTHREMTDLGGGIKKNETSTQAAHREFHEETRGIFDQVINTLSLSNCKSFIGNYTTVTFVQVHPGWRKLANERFKSRKSAKKIHNEISELLWVSSDDLGAIIKGGGKVAMWEKLTNDYINIMNLFNLARCESPQV